MVDLPQEAVGPNGFYHFDCILAQHGPVDHIVREVKPPYIQMFIGMP